MAKGIENGEYMWGIEERKHANAFRGTSTFEIRKHFLFSVQKNVAFFLLCAVQTCLFECIARFSFRAILISLAREKTHFEYFKTNYTFVCFMHKYRVIITRFWISRRLLLGNLLHPRGSNTLAINRRLKDIYTNFTVSSRPLVTQFICIKIKSLVNQISKK